MSILEKAKKRQITTDGAYAGCVTPNEASELCLQNQAVLIDVRTIAEITYVGRVPWGDHIEWLMYPAMDTNSKFVDELQQSVSKDKPLLFLCRSGVRSHYAACVASQAGYESYNILEGFEGQIDKEGHRNKIDGWRFRDLPWIQT